MRRIGGVALATLVVAGLGWLLHLGSWLGHNGDHYYYASTALQYAGVPYDEAVARTAAYFSYPLPVARLDYGYLSPIVAPLIYPRVVLPLVAAPFTTWFGLPGVYVPGIAFGSLSTVTLLVLAYRRVGVAGALPLGFLLMGSTLATEFVFGIYSEAPVIAAAALLLVTLPLGVPRRTVHAVAAAGLVPVMMLSRQVPLLPLGMVLGGWLWAALATRRGRNEWLPFVALVVPVTVASYALVARWAPYSPLPFLRAITRAGSDAELLRALPGLFWHALRLDLTYAMHQDRVGVLLWSLGAVGLVLAVRSPLAGVFAGSAASGLVAVALNGQPDYFRYLAPSLPPLALLVAVATDRLWALVRRRTWLPPAVARPPAPPAGIATAANRTHRVAARTGAALAWGLVAALVSSTVLLHRPASGPTAAEHLDRASWRGSWPFTAPSGSLTCTGPDYEMWFTTDDGSRYAVSGTAMSRAFGAPTVTAIRPEPRTFGWPALTPVLEEGKRLCDAARGP